MPYPVQNLIEGRSEPVTVSPTDPAQKALALMIEHDFSQLPVTNEAGRTIGMVTHESILRALSYFGTSIDEPHIADAIVKVPLYRPEEDLFDLLDRLRDTNAVLIVDGEQKLIGIVTSYDSTEYFRRRAEDMMLVEDIENMLKDIILSVYSGVGGNTDQDKLRTAIEEITSSSQESKKRYGKAISEYLRLAGQIDINHDPNALELSFTLLAPKVKPKTFDQLTLADYIALITHPKHWDEFAPCFNIDLNALQKLLDDIRETRNTLAHFRGEITPEQRGQLKFCVEWLARHLSPIAIKLPVSAQEELEIQVTIEDQVSIVESVDLNIQPGDTVQEIIPTEEEIGASESRYAPLAIWLQSQPGEINRAPLIFSDIEAIIGGELPASARVHRAWWANDPSHSHAQQWLDAGWRTSYVNLSEERVTFVRTEERGRDYIEFFSRLLTDLRASGGMPVKDVSLSGRSWMIILGIPEGGPEKAIFVFAFSRNNRFRVELYIDTGIRDQNKRVFDLLFQKKYSIEAPFGNALAWERIDKKRACRIAFYTQGSITDPKEELTELRKWAVDNMVLLYQVLMDPATQALIQETQQQ